MQVTRDKWVGLQGELADAQLSVKNWKLEATRYRDKRLAEQKRADYATGFVHGSDLRTEQVQKWFRTMLTVNWILWGINILVILLLI